ncbi:bifunctional proline dehydrogenase/L-glutamate gamma-semialdehyde dehydrogenase PutA [Vitreimonas sp.]|jgi:RHH-type proline utilization regulon transcriptional repressor/proline dehydrogenase/delta 1-pyrroline-5-carboxylate dehydrogenase|uniref:bifunctional proline dehydrogenase/L-glutamate gamma-semialdehyde dehydrogenase PutA n=1 Tax=Vitreimonas sp. TaxID=3069702 RepID=UPI002ED832CA
MTTRMDGARAAMTALYRAPEQDVLKALLPAATLPASTRGRVVTRAKTIIADLRAAQSSGWVNRFLQEYRLNTEEGVALLALAEAFLRVPDPETADMLIRDKLGGADWAAHAGQSESLMVNSATFGLVLTRALVGESREAGALKRLVARAGEPFVRTAVGTAMRMMGQVFVMGRTIDEAMKRAADEDNRGFTASFDMLGEGARTYGDAEKYFAAYEAAIESVATSKLGRGHSISVKLSALHPRYETSHADTCVPELIEMTRRLARKAAAANVGFTIDAEECDRLMMSLDIIEGVARDPALKSWDGLGMAVQAYGKRARAVIAWADALGEDIGRKFMVRLVKGAYWDSEIKRAQVESLSDYPLFTRKAATDVSYLACASDMLASRNLFPAFASHNALTVATILEWVGERRDFEFQRLHGMGEGLYERLVREQGYACRTYAPVGGHRELLAYLVRRLLENGANSSFVHQLADPDVTEDDLLADPADRIAKVGGKPHPSIPLPRDIFPGRVNSGGIDLHDAALLEKLATQIKAMPTTLQASPLISGVRSEGAAKPVRCPANRARNAGAVIDATGDDVTRAIAAAKAAADSWNATPVEDRAQCLERLADLMEANRTELMALAVHEAGKSIPDALAEIREAVDFCRYYAIQARTQFAPERLPGPTGELNEIRLAGRGVFACIAPWNFPLAIFLGQVAAALVAGNSVLAKPAPQTPLIAYRAIQLAHEAGVPKDVLHFLPGGPEVGRVLTADPRIAGVAFTGSTGTARTIARALLDNEQRGIVPLIAETGGLNAMIVDSTALPEQVVGDVVTSAFRSAGQRCSALRLLVLQEDVADRILDMLKGAMDALILGDPLDIRTDVGPVIDEAARDKLEAYRQSMKARWVHALEAPQGGGLFVPPTVIKLDQIEDLKQEWFGPILHVATWKAGELDQTIARINSSGFGLTMGLHSRIAGASERVRQLAKVGNLYVNRSMIGAVVGSQPFGGEGFSGTGPKAGGPRYVARFATERVVSIDTTSAGGNASLLSIEDVGF